MEENNCQNVKRIDVHGSCVCIPFPHKTTFECDIGCAHRINALIFSSQSLNWINGMRKPIDCLWATTDYARNRRNHFALNLYCNHMLLSLFFFSCLNRFMSNTVAACHACGGYTYGGIYHQWSSRVCREKHKNEIIDGGRKKGHRTYVSDS